MICERTYWRKNTSRKPFQLPPTETVKTSFVRRQVKDDTIKSKAKLLQEHPDGPDFNHVATISKTPQLLEQVKSNKVALTPSVDSTEDQSVPNGLNVNNAVDSSKNDSQNCEKNITESVQHKLDTAGNDSRGESGDDLSPLNESNPSNLPAEILRFKRDRYESTDSSVDDEGRSTEILTKKSKKLGKCKSFSAVDSVGRRGEPKAMTLAKHLSKKLNLSVKTSDNVESDGGSGYYPSGGSSGDEVEYIENDEVGGSQEKVAISRNDTSTAPSFSR